MIIGMERRAIAFRARIKSNVQSLAWILLLPSLTFASRAVADGTNDMGAEFHFHGQPVHPLIIKQFEPWTSDERPPLTVEINISAAWDSNQYADAFNTDTNGVVSVK